MISFLKVLRTKSRGFSEHMMVLGRSSKRQHRPNVRLGEIGDLPTAFSCGVSVKTQRNSRNNRYKDCDAIDISFNEYDQNTGFHEETATPCKLLVLDPGGSPGFSIDSQHNSENKDPNSGFDMCMSNLGFGAVPKKSRIMKRQSRRDKGLDYASSLKLVRKLLAPHGIYKVDTLKFY